MAKVLLFIIFVFSFYSSPEWGKLTAIVSVSISVSTQAEQDEISFGQSNNDEFDWSLIKALLKTEESNVIISPFSIKLLLTILFEAAGDYSSTRQELSNALLSDETDKKILRGSFKKQLESLKQLNENYTLYLGTCIFVDHHNRLNQKFGATIQHNYETSIDRQNFRLVDRVNKYINDWVSRITHNKINQVVSPKDIEESVILLVNAIYFRGSWLKPFNKEQTRISNFYTKFDKQIRTSFIRQTGYFYYYESKSLNAKILRLQYKGNKFAMTIVLPNIIEGLDDLIQNSNITKIQSFKNDLTKVYVRISLPKFRFDYKAELSKTLQSMGIRTIFADNASLAALANGVDLTLSPKVSGILQNAGIAVTEEGTTVNATSTISFVNINSGTVEFIADHPFLFFIEDEKKGSVILSGRVGDPTKGSL